MGVLVRGDRETLARAFGVLIDLQPVAWVEDGLLCAPRIDPDRSTATLDTCPFPTEVRPVPCSGPTTAAALVAGWYRRSERHVPSPASLPELVQADGAAFGPGDHVTTAMCLAALDGLPPVPAIDVGCGSGLLAQAWARRHGAEVLAIDADPAAVAQTRRSVDAAGLGDLVAVRHRRVEALTSQELEGRVVLANVPAQAHHALLTRFASPPAAAVLSGLRPAQAPAVLRGYADLGLRRVRATRARRFECHALVAGR